MKNEEILGNEKIGSTDTKTITSMPDVVTKTGTPPRICVSHIIAGVIYLNLPNPSDKKKQIFTQTLC